MTKLVGAGSAGYPRAGHERRVVRRREHGPARRSGGRQLGGGGVGVQAPERGVEPAGVEAGRGRRDERRRPAGRERGAVRERQHGADRRPGRQRRCRRDVGVHACWSRRARSSSARARPAPPVRATAWPCRPMRARRSSAARATATARARPGCSRRRGLHVEPAGVEARRQRRGRRRLSGLQRGAVGGREHGADRRPATTTATSAPRGCSRVRAERGPSRAEARRQRRGRRGPPGGRAWRCRRTGHGAHRRPRTTTTMPAPRGCSPARAACGPSRAPKLVGGGAIGAAHQGVGRGVVGGREHGADRRLRRQRRRRGGVGVHPLGRRVDPAGREARRQRRDRHAAQGYGVALSADGNTALVGGYADNASVGAAWVFAAARAATWTQQGGEARRHRRDRAEPARQGWSVGLSADGSRALLGGFQDNLNTGAAWVFARTGMGWGQQGPKVVGDGAEGAASQGFSAALSGDGNTALLGGDTDGNGTGLGAAWVIAFTPASRTSAPASRSPASRPTATAGSRSPSRSPTGTLDARATRCRAPRATRSRPRCHGSPAAVSAWRTRADGT